MVSLANYQDLYRVASEMRHDGLKNIALYFLMYKIEQLPVSQFFLRLPCEDCCKILSHSMLNVPGEFRVVELILSWLKHQDVANTEQMDMLAMQMMGYVRWARISSAEVDYLMSKEVVMSSKFIQQFIRSEIAKSVKSVARGWPKLLLLVETPRNLEEIGISEECTKTCSVQSYDADTKQWSRVSQVPGTREMGYSVTAVQNSLVITWSNNSVPYIPVAVQTYDIWSNSWSKQPTLKKVRKASNLEAHSTVCVKEKVYTVIVPTKEQSMTSLCLHTLSGVFTDSPLWSIVCHPVPKTEPDVPYLATTGDLVHVIGYRDSMGSTRHSLDTYNPGTQAWTGGVLECKDKVVNSGWVGWAGGLARIGGICRDTLASSDECVLFPVQGGKGKPFASMVRKRVEPGLVEYKGMLFAAGGFKKLSEQKRSKKKKNSEVVISEPVEYYVPELDCWNLMRTQPELAYGNVTMVVVDKPIRLMSKGDMGFEVKIGVKRPFME